MRETTEQMKKRHAEELTRSESLDAYERVVYPELYKRNRLLAVLGNYTDDEIAAVVELRRNAL